MKIIKKTVRCKICDAKITQGRVIEIYKHIVCEECCIKLAKTDLTLIDAEDKLTSSCRCSKEEIPEECLSTCCAFPLGPFLRQV